LERVRGRRFSVLHCPASNLKLGSGIADLVAIRGAGVPVGIGTDGAPCSNDLDALFQLRIAALLQHHRSGPASFSGLDALRLATSEGARAIGLGAVTGSLETGKAADLLVLSRARPEAWGPRADPHDLIAYSASRADVRHVVVAGEVVVEDGRLTRLDLGAVQARADAALAAVASRSGIGRS
jgi:5-methylthioadenosine/S-adenosylhomocysteine deaminase